MSSPGERREHIPGNKAIWVGIYAELTEFALMFLVYFVARAHHPDAFGAGAQTLSTLAGTVITAIMITNGRSSKSNSHAWAAS
jgi:cytochrome c oxidase subunit 3